MQNKCLRALALKSQISNKLYDFAQSWLQSNCVFILDYNEDDWKENKLYKLNKPPQKFQDISFIDLLVSYEPYLTKRGCKGLILKKEDKLFVAWTIPVSKAKTFETEGLEEFIPMTEEEIEQNKKIRKENTEFENLCSLLASQLRITNSIDLYKSINEELKIILDKF